MTLPTIATTDSYTGDSIRLDLAFGIADNLFCLADLAGLGERIAFNADGGCGVFGCGNESGFIETDNHAGEVVGAEASKGVVDELFGAGGGVLGVAD